MLEKVQVHSARSTSISVLVSDQTRRGPNLKSRHIIFFRTTRFPDSGGAAVEQGLGEPNSKCMHYTCTYKYVVCFYFYSTNKAMVHRSLRETKLYVTTCTISFSKPFRQPGRKNAQRFPFLCSERVGHMPEHGQVLLVRGASLVLYLGRGIHIRGNNAT